MNTSNLVKTISCLLFFLILSLFVWMNATPGSFRYAPDDGCACFSSYSTVPVDQQCEQSRKINCDESISIDDFLVFLAHLDFYK